MTWEDFKTVMENANVRPYHQLEVEIDGPTEVVCGACGKEGTTKIKQVFHLDDAVLETQDIHARIILK